MTPDEAEQRAVRAYSAALARIWNHCDKDPALFKTFSEWLRDVMKPHSLNVKAAINNMRWSGPFAAEAATVVIEQFEARLLRLH